MAMLTPSERDARRKAKDAERKRIARAKKREQDAARAAAVAAGVGVEDERIESAAASGNLSVLVGIRDDHHALNSDRIRAAAEIGKLEASGAVEDPYAGLKALRHVLEAVPPAERVGALTKLLAGSKGSDVVLIEVADDTP